MNSQGSSWAGSVTSSEQPATSAAARASRPSAASGARRCIGEPPGPGEGGRAGRTALVVVCEKPRPGGKPECRSLPPVHLSRSRPARPGFTIPPMNCPACRTEMFVMEYDGLELDHCPQCEGVWFDATELALLFDGHPDLADEAIADLPDADTDEKGRRCPMCRRSMRKVNIGTGKGVLVDVCGQDHGLFFDRGEVAALAVALPGRDDRASSRLLAFLGETYRGDRAASETEES
ncbi:hypothetical protein GF314_14345 [bacterium]|nr:hypothetical protein [bacterium]